MMIKMEKNLGGSNGFFQWFAITFTISLLAVSVIGFFEGEGAKGYSELYALGNDGLSFAVIAQIALFAFVSTVVQAVILSERVFKNLLLLWRAVLLLLLNLLTAAVMSVAFHWFPADYPLAWAAFFISFFTCFAVSCGIMVLKTWLASRKYSRLLLKYQKERTNSK